MRGRARRSRVSIRRWLVQSASELLLSQSLRFSRLGEERAQSDVASPVFLSARDIRRTGKQLWHHFVQISHWKIMPQVPSWMGWASDFVARGGRAPSMTVRLIRRKLMVMLVSYPQNL